MNTAEILVRFSGLVECRIDPQGPLGLTLTGPEGGGAVLVSFVCAAPPDWPQRLDAPLVLREGPQQFRIGEGRADRRLEASRVFVHRDVTRVFDQAIPPRRAPLAKRAFWRAVLALAATSVGRRVLYALRG